MNEGTRVRVIEFGRGTKPNPPRGFDFKPPFYTPYCISKEGFFGQLHGLISLCCLSCRARVHPLSSSTTVTSVRAFRARCFLSTCPRCLSCCTSPWETRVGDQGVVLDGPNLCFFEAQVGRNEPRLMRLDETCTWLLGHARQRCKAEVQGRPFVDFPSRLVFPVWFSRLVRR